MRKIEILTFLLVLAASFAYSQAVVPQPTQTAPQQPYIGITVLQNPPVVYPGGVVQLTVVLTTTSVVGPIEVQISSSNLVVLTGGLYKLAGLAPTSPATLTAVLKAPLGLRPGSYGVTVALINPINGFQIQSYMYSIQISPLSLDALATPIIKGFFAPGQTVEIPVFFVNPASTDVVKATATIAGGPFGQFLNASLSCSAYVPPNSNATCVIPAVIAADAEPGSYTARLNVTYIDTADNSTISFSKNFTVIVMSPVDFNVALTPQGSVVAGLPSVMTLFVSAGSPIQPTNVTITPVNTSDITFIARPIKLPILTSIQIPLEVILNKYGTVTASFEICYFNNICTTRNVTIYIPTPNLAINIAQNPPWAYPGSIVQLTAVLAANQPMGPLSVTVNAPGLSILEGSHYSLPGLAPGTPATLTILLEVPRGAAPGLYPLSIEAGSYNYTYYIDVKPANLGASIIANPPTAYPGAVVSLNVVLTSDAQIRGVAVNISTPLQVLEGASYYLPALPSGSPVTLTSVIKIPDGATPGDYPVYVSVNGKTYVAYIHVESPSVIIQNIAVEPPVVVANSLLAYAKVVVSLLNTGLVPARDVVLSVSGVPVVGNSTINLGVLPPGQPVQVPFLINASALGPGSQSIVATASWLGGETKAATTLTVLPKAALKVSYSVSNAQPGSTAVVTLTITNVGSVPAKMVTLQWTPNQVFQIHTPSSSTPTTNLLASNTRVLGDIYPGQNITTTYLIDVSSNIPSGVYYATLVLEWNETGAFTPVVETIQIPIAVNSSINLLEVGPLAAAALIAALGVAIYLRRRGAKKSA
ncbi:MAG: hypothetical protein ABWJ97_06720 [Thermoproteus sp.]